MKIYESFKQKFQIANVYGIPVRADYRWFFVFILMTWITAINIHQFTGNSVASGLFGFFTTVIFFASIFLHELAHAIMARMEGLRVLEIVLHPFGGLARFRHEPETPRAEFRIAIAGPAASFLLALVFLGLMSAANLLGENNILSPLFFLLFLLNFLLAVFNMFPGYPLDGGRVLRSFLWKRGTDLNDATILTGRFGQIIAVVMIGFGIIIALSRGDLFTGLWTVLVGLFLFDSAKGIIKQVNNLDTLVVEDVMTLPISVEPETSVQQFVDRILTLHRQTVFPVAKDKQLYGILSLADFKSLPREDWHKTKVKDVMRPIAVEHFVETGTLLKDARQLMRENNIGAIGVIDGEGKLVGFMRRKK